MLLAFDTSTPAVTVALVDDDRVLASITHVDPLRHGELLAPTIEQVLAQAWVKPADLDLIAVGVGPGPFTGLRVGVVTAQVMAAALGVPVTGVCSLDILAMKGPAEGEFVVATDARRKEVFFAHYRDSRRVSEPQVARPTDVATSLPTLGAGPRLYPDAFPHAYGPELPDATDLALGLSRGRLHALAVAPLYLRRPDTTEPGSRKRVS
jgi:tRNA threonylcarbamoyladenosine biosynthesis protein TsaB